MQINYKWKNILLTIIFLLFFIILFLVSGFNLVGNDILITKQNITPVYFVFVGFYFLVSEIIFLWEKKNYKILFLKSSLVFFIVSLLYAIISIPIYLIINNIKLEASITTNDIVFWSIELFLLLILLTYLTIKYIYMIYAVSMKENLKNEFINRYAWTLFFWNFKIKEEKEFLIIKKKKTLFILEFFKHFDNSLLIQFEDERLVVENKKDDENKKENLKEKKEIKNLELTEEKKTEKNNEQIKEAEKIKTEKILPNEFARRLLKIFSENKNREKNVYILNVFDEFSNIKVRGNIPEWYYWNEKKIIIKYIKKLIKVN